MPTDYKSYVRRPAQGQAPRSERRGHPQDAPLPGWIWFTGGLLVGVVAMGVTWLLDSQAITEAVEAQMQNVGKPQQAKRAGSDAAGGQTQSPPKEQHQFDFYSLLPAMEVEVQPDSLRPAAAKPAAAVASASPAEIKPEAVETEKTTEKSDLQSQFQMQIASFRARADAERMLASPVLQGISARIEKVTINDKAYYRVRSGPYSREQAYSLHKRLKKGGIESLIMRVKG